MKRMLSVLCGAGALLTATPALAVVDVVEAPTGFFAPGSGATNSAPYWRFGEGDWGWSHGAVGGSFTTASLFISGYDVDFGEIDNIYGKKGGVQTLIGSLTQTGSNVFSYTEFALDSSWFADIAAGLELWVDIDAGNDGWALTLGKSVITTDGTAPPPPTPGAVPEPATWAMMILGFAVIGAALRSQKRREKLTVTYA
ncbi:MAG: hypothetical protein B7Z33_09600 [Sphingomonadales bacterium 12-68-11]|nr:MAG: hypothetical protein B7Z33_09600 [Sphingomonadales bacterium 12-68-11]